MAVSEERITSTFREGENIKTDPRGSSDTSARIYQTTRRHDLDDRYLYPQRVADEPRARNTDPKHSS
jgi:hypothetical protein